MKRLLDRICERDGLSRPELADALGISRHTLSTAAYRGEIGFGLILDIAQRADATPTELMELEVLWLKGKSEKPRDEALRRCLSISQLLFDEVAALEEWLEKRGMLKDYLRSRKRKQHPMEERSERLLGGIEE